MMRPFGGVVAVAVAVLFVCCQADSHTEQDHNSAERFDNGHKAQNLDAIGSKTLVRQVRESRPSDLIPQFLIRQYDYISPYGGKREQWPVSSGLYTGYNGDGLPKRNFDEIDRSNMNTFVRKRNFDEIDQTNMPFPFATKRFFHVLGSNYFDTPISNYDKKRARPDFPMDEIDLSHFPVGSKRSVDSVLFNPRAL